MTRREWYPLEPGKYRFTFADGKSSEVTTSAAEASAFSRIAWTLSFPQGWGAIAGGDRIN